MNFTWRNLYLDLLLDAGIDGLEVVEAVQPARSIRIAEFQQAGLRIQGDDGVTLAALGAEFLPDQSGQLLVLVLSSGDDLTPGGEPQPGLSRPLAEAVLAGVTAGPAVDALGSGVLRVDRALMGAAATPDVFGWLAGAVVRLLGADVDAMSDEEVAALLGVAYEPHPPAVEPAPEPAEMADDLPPEDDFTEPAPELELEPLPEPAPEPDAPAEPLDEPEEEAPAARWRLFDGMWAEEEDGAPAEAYEPPLDEARREMLRLLTEDVEARQTPEQEEGDPARRYSLRDIARDEIGDEAAEMLSEDDLRMLVEALRGHGAEGPPVEVYEVKEAPPGAQVYDAEPVEDSNDWLEDYEAVMQQGGEQPEEEPEAPPTFEAAPEPPARPAGPPEQLEVEEGEWFEAPSPAGPMPLRDMARHVEAPEPPAPVQPEVEAAPPASDTPEAIDEGLREVPEELRYENPPRARVRSISGERTTYYLCPACSRFSAVKVGPDQYRCYRCEAEIEYRHGAPAQRPSEWEDQPEP